MTWETCTLRKWLNDTFYKAAFSKEERAAIIKKTISNNKNQGYSKWYTSGGNSTKDKVFLLSYAEANKYFNVTYDGTNNLKARIEPTEYAIEQNAIPVILYRTTDGKPAVDWWLRSPGNFQDCAAAVALQGSLGAGSVHSTLAVRPALWVNLDADIFK